MATVVSAETFSPTESSFFDARIDMLHSMFAALGREAEWRDNPTDLLAYTQQKWVGLDHGNSVEKDQFTDDQVEAAKELMGQLGLKDEILPSAGSYEQTIIIGGMMRVNRERIKFMKQLIDGHRVKTERIVFWAGQRLRDARDDAQVDAMDLISLSADPWVKDEFTRSVEAGWGSRFATETQLGRLAYLENFRPARLSRISTEMQLTSAKNVPRRGVSRYTFITEGYPEFVLMNSTANERPQGVARHTTESCAREWFEKLPPAQDSKVLVVSGNPHILRNSRNIQQIAIQNGRPDIEFTVCGPAAAPNATVQLFLGEIGRLIYMDAVSKRQLVTS